MISKYKCKVWKTDKCVVVLTFQNKMDGEVAIVDSRKKNEWMFEHF